ncbi:MAG: bifunctional 4-hydroxy-2-oxoglutarate aldolase/2-dehydro-3-deoxy-phosphogluconate aldolase [Steroidobacteraceae bacterium]
MSVESLLSISPVIPVVTLHDPRHAVPLARTLLEGGIGVIEVTLRTPAAITAIEQIATQVGGIAVLAGTVCSEEQARASLRAGAAAIVSPGITEHLAGVVRKLDAAWLPGIATASEIMGGLEFGLDHFKLFPAKVAGGLEALEAFAGPFPGVRFCPTGGIDQSNSQRYLGLANVACVGGSWIAPTGLVQAADWNSIRANAEFAAALRR